MKRINTLLFIVGIIIFYIILYLFKPVIQNSITSITLILIMGIFAITAFLILKKKFTIKNIIFTIMIIGILIRGMYIIYTSVNERQHDVYSINEQGHLGYIYCIYETGKLPTNNDIQFYHPPLFHLIGAGWLKINTVFNVELDRAIEGVQVITGIFSSLILIVVYRIIEKFDVKDIYKLLIVSVMTLHPTFIMLSGSINNDILLTLLTFLIILYLIKWYEKSDIKNTILLAIFTGLAVMTKISAAIMAVPIIYIFIKKYFLEYKEKKLVFNRNLFIKMLLFGAVSLPIGLWHPVRNFILFNQPIGGILIPSQVFNIEKYSIFSRFFSISFKELFIETFAEIPGDHNIFSFIVKSSVLGEYSFENIDLLAITLKLVNFLLILISLICTALYIFRKKQKNYIIEILLITWLINIVSYYNFNVVYPYTCTMDFRYLIPTLFTGITLICVYLNSIIKANIVKKIVELIIILFCVLSLILFFVI